MNLSQLLDRITSRQKKRDKARRSEYLQMVFRIANGEEPEEDQLARLLAETGNSADDLREHVKTMADRIEWRRQLDRQKVLQAEKDSIRDQIAAADAVLDKAENEHADIVLPLQARVEAIRREISDCHHAEHRLIDTCLDENLLAELKDLNARFTAEDSRRSELQSEIQRMRDLADGDRREAERQPYPTHQEEMRQWAESRERRADKLEPQLDEAAKNAEQLRKRIDKLQERLLVP